MSGILICGLRSLVIFHALLSGVTNNVMSGGREGGQFYCSETYNNMRILMK